MTTRQGLRAVPGGKKTTRGKCPKCARSVVLKVDRTPRKHDCTPVKKTAKRKLTVAQAAVSGDHKSLLVAVRDRIAQSVQDPECSPRDLAALTRRLQDIAKEVEAIELREKQEAAEDAIEPDEPWDEETL